jgi:hypothetical protein
MKQTVMGAIERGGETRFAHIPDSKGKTIREFVEAHLSPDAEKIMIRTSRIHSRLHLSSHIVT